MISRESGENPPTPPRTITGFSCPLWSQATAAVGEKEAAFRVAPGSRGQLSLETQGGAIP